MFIYDLSKIYPILSTSDIYMRGMRDKSRQTKCRSPVALFPSFINCRLFIIMTHNQTGGAVRIFDYPSRDHVLPDFGSF